MPYPIPLFRDEKEFLNSMHPRVPGLKDRFEQAVNTYPAYRLEKLPSWMQSVRRSVWREIGIDDNEAGTLADHVALMCQLAVLHTGNHEPKKILDLILAHIYPRAISGDHSHSGEISPEEDRRLRKLSVRLLYDAERSHPYRIMAEYLDDLEADDIDWVRDLDLLATYIKSREFENTRSGKISQGISALQTNIAQSMKTDKGRSLLEQTGKAQNSKPAAFRLPFLHP